MILLYTPLTVFIEVYAACKMMIAQALNCPPDWIRVTASKEGVVKIETSYPEDGAQVAPQSVFFAPLPPLPEGATDYGEVARRKALVSNTVSTIGRAADEEFRSRVKEGFGA